MKTLLTCRRTLLAFFGVACLTALGWFKGADVASAIAAVSIGLSGSFAIQQFKPQVLPK
jgi:hypothetical protein